MVLLGRLHLDIFRHSLTISCYVHFPSRYNCIFGLTFRAWCRYFESAWPMTAKLRSACDFVSQRVTAEVPETTHPTQKEGAVYPHDERDVGKDPFNPNGIVELPLRNTQKSTRSTAHASDPITPQL